MNREQWEHVIAAAANVTKLDAFVVIGSQAILGPFPDAPSDLLRSQEADIYAEYLRCSRERIHALLTQRRLARHKDGARTLILRAELESYVRSATDLRRAA